MLQMQALVGVAEVSRMLGMTKQCLAERRKLPDFPEPAVQLASGPVWFAQSIVEYARARNQKYVERPGVHRLATRGTGETRDG